MLYATQVAGCAQACYGLTTVRNRINQKWISLARAGSLASNGRILETTPNQYAQLVGSIPHSYHRLDAEQSISIGERQWKIHIGHGHASHHATLWSDDGIAINGRTRFFAEQLRI